MTRWGLVVALGCLLLEPTVAAAQAMPPDIVILRDGTMMRGTILAVAPDGNVQIQLPDGALRDVPTSTTRYAGPAGDSPTFALTDAEPAPIAVDPPPGTAHVTLRTRAEQLHLWRWTNADPVEICALPCTADLRIGDVVFGFSTGDGRAQLLREHFDVAPGAVFDIDFVDHHGARIAGIALLVAGLLLGGGLIATGIAVDSGLNPAAPSAGIPLDVVGGILCLGGLVTGAALLSWHDSIDVDPVVDPDA